MSNATAVCSHYSPELLLNAHKDVTHEDAIKVGGLTKAPDYCFRVGGARKFFVEAKKLSECAQQHESAIGFLPFRKVKPDSRETEPSFTSMPAVLSGCIGANSADSSQGI